MGLLEALSLIRFFLGLLAANPAAGFTKFIYGITKIFAAPFINVFGASRIEVSVIEWTTLLVMLVYWLLAYAIIKLFVMGKPVSTVEADVKLQEQDQ